MKTLKSLAAVAIIALFSLSYSSCETASDESCEQQDMNEILNCGVEKNVEVCCTTGAGCVYTYNGQDYPDTNTGLSNLADALGCTYKSSANYEDEKKLIIQNLIDLKDRAKFGLE
jgi:hypothetical protein